jgi:hypothetical protein
MKTQMLLASKLISIVLDSYSTNQNSCIQCRQLIRRFVRHCYLLLRSNTRTDIQGTVYQFIRFLQRVNAYAQQRIGQNCVLAAGIMLRGPSSLLGYVAMSLKQE